MISLPTACQALESTIPLYAAMALAYFSVKWWKLFTPNQCSAINKFVAKISIPLLSYEIVSTTNPYQLNLKLLLADIVQKSLALLIFIVLSKVHANASYDLMITGFAVSTLPNTLIVGIPLVKGLYGDEAAAFLGQIVVLQSLVWYTILLFLFEFRAAKMVQAMVSENTVHTTNTSSAQEVPVAVLIEQEEKAAEEIQETVNPRNEENEALSTRKHKFWVILSKVGRKLIINPNTYACLIGLLWALIRYRCGVMLPTIVKNSISIIANGGLGMAMFSLGLFMASQTRIVACGFRMMILSLVLRFIVGPTLMAIPSFAIQMRGTLLNVAIIQAALPQGIVPFVFAKDYNVYPEILSTGVIVGMLLAIPVALIYSLVLGHD